MRTREGARRGLGSTTRASRTTSKSSVWVGERSAPVVERCALKDVQARVDRAQHRALPWKLVDPHGSLVGLCVVHVDDFLIGLDEQSVYAQGKLQELKELYKWGSWED